MYMPPWRKASFPVCHQQTARYRFNRRLKIRFSSNLKLLRNFRNFFRADFESFFKQLFKLVFKRIFKRLWNRHLGRYFNTDSLLIFQIHSRSRLAARMRHPFPFVRFAADWKEASNQQSWGVGEDGRGLSIQYKVRCLLGSLWLRNFFFHRGKRFSELTRLVFLRASIIDIRRRIPSGHIPFPYLSLALPSKYVWRLQLGSPKCRPRKQNHNV